MVYVFARDAEPMRGDGAQEGTALAKAYHAFNVISPAGRKRIIVQRQSAT